MEEIKNIINNIIGQLSEHQPNQDKELFDLWEQLLDDTEKKHVRLSGLKSGSLYVNVDSSAWLYQMKLKRTQLLKKVQKEFSNVKNIYLKIGPLS